MDTLRQLEIERACERLVAGYAEVAASIVPSAPLANSSTATAVSSTSMPG